MDHESSTGRHLYHLEPVVLDRRNPAGPAVVGHGFRDFRTDYYAAHDFHTMPLDNHLHC